MYNTKGTCFVLIFALFQTDLSSAHWNYNEAGWPIECKEGNQQSPIALSREIAEEENFSSLIFDEYNQTYPVQSKNNGHSIEIRLHVQKQPTVKGGGLPFVYVLDHLHFHWQSEHVVENQRYPLELHLVHYASRYGNLSEGLKHPSGVAVFSVLFYLSPDADVQFEPLVDVIDKLEDQVGTVQEMHIKVNDFLPRDRAGFYRYNGSLTTPDCTEGIVWTVFTNMLPLSRDQIKSFPLVQSDEHEQLVKNYRSLQKLNGRKVQIRSSPIYSSASTKIIDIVSITLFFLSVILM